MTRLALILALALAACVQEAPDPGPDATVLGEEPLYDEEPRPWPGPADAGTEADTGPDGDGG